jgi:hypothetical protein
MSMSDWFDRALGKQVLDRSEALDQTTACSISRGVGWASTHLHPIGVRLAASMRARE